MGFKNILNILNGIASPNQAINMMLNKMPRQTSDMLRNLLRSGQSPKQAIMDSAKSGRINLDQLNQAKSLYNSARKLGFRKLNVPDNIWNEAEKLIQNSNHNQDTYTRF